MSNVLQKALAVKTEQEQAEFIKQLSEDELRELSKQMGEVLLDVAEKMRQFSESLAPVMKRIVDIFNNYLRDIKEGDE
jgi:transcriptional regulator of NAD metabolism